MASTEQKKIIFILSVDTEEEFDWGQGFPQQNCSVQNIEELPAFQRFCESKEIRPTYLVDYPVAENNRTAGIIRAIIARGGVEVGSHLHPWCTPPISGPNDERASHVVNLSDEIVQAKLDSISDAIRNNIGVNPVVFRTGRWGMNSAVLNIVKNAGYKVDSSIYPYYENDYFSCLDSLDRPYWPSMLDPDRAGSQRSILELPVTAGFNRTNFRFWGAVHKKLSSPYIRMLRPVGVAWHTNLLKKLYMSPELSSASEMIALASSAIHSGYPVIHMFLHSSSLLPGKSPYIGSEVDKEYFYRCISQTLEFLRSQAEVECCTISEAAERLISGFGEYSIPCGKN